MKLLGKKSRVSDQPPPLGKRIEKCRKLFHLSMWDIQQFWDIFKRHDTTHDGYISVDTYFDKVVFEPKSTVGQALFALIDTDDPNKIEFGEFVQAVCTFACLSPAEMLRFAFMVYDKDKSGVMEVEQLHDFIWKLHNSDVSNNVQHAMQDLTLDELGRLPFDSFKLLNKQYPQVMYPLFRLQQNTMRFVMGPKWWASKLRRLEYERVHRQDVEKRKAARAERLRIMQREKLVLHAIGLKDYIFNPDKRQQFVDVLEAARGLGVNPNSNPNSAAASAATSTARVPPGAASPASPSSRTVIEKGAKVTSTGSKRADPSSRAPSTRNMLRESAGNSTGNGAAPLAAGKP